jgi:hypothetical protein
VSLIVSLFWMSLAASALVFALGQAVPNATLRSTCVALALVALITTGLIGAAWATMSS